LLCRCQCICFFFFKRKGRHESGGGVRGFQLCAFPFFSGGANPPRPGRALALLNVPPPLLRAAFLRTHPPLHLRPRGSRRAPVKDTLPKDRREIARARSAWRKGLAITGPISPAAGRLPVPFVCFNSGEGDRPWFAGGVVRLNDRG